MSENISINEQKSVLEEVRKGAKYKQCDKDRWKRSVAKKLKTHGECYTSVSTGKEVPGKVFSLIKKCCSCQCFSKFCLSEQNEIYNSFYNLLNKESQDVFLASCIAKNVSEIHRFIDKPKKNRANIWDYSLKKAGVCVNICRSFLISLLKITPKRIRVIQAKILSNSSFEEKRGTHGHQKKVEEGVYTLAMEHLRSIPHRKSHYTTTNRSNRAYFDNPDITIKDIFEAFQVFYKNRTGKCLRMQKKTYYHFFSQTNFTTKKPKTDTCDICKGYEVKLTTNPNDACKPEYMLHKKRAEKHDELKKGYIESAKTSDEILVCEFDYAQNLPLPKLTVSKQFYKRLVWLYLFNVHCHNDGDSFMYYFIESTARKGPDSVVSFVFDFLQKKIEKFPKIKKIVLLSDAAGGQNKNQTLMKFCLYIASNYSVEVIHMFPVRGHTFGQCDRNFGLIKSKIKPKEDIETVEQYLNLIQKSRSIPSPFSLVSGKPILYEWDKGLTPFFLKNPISKNIKFGIQKYCILKYHNTGYFSASSSYNAMYQPFKYMKTKPDHLVLDVSPCVPFKVGSQGQGKIKDVRDLYQFLKPDSIAFFESVFSSAESVETNKDDNDVNEVLAVPNGD